jgi:hypothetical protein
MLEDKDTLAAVAGLGGFIIGYGFKTILVNRKLPKKGRSFTDHQLKRWNCKSKWSDILLRKDKAKYAQSELEKVQNEKKRETSKLDALKKERDKSLDNYNEIRLRAKNANSDIEQRVVLQEVGNIAAELSAIRRRLDGVSNVFVTHHKRLTFLEFVLRDESMADISEGMDLVDLKGVLEDNKGHAMDMTQAEIEAMGSVESFADLMKLMNI